MRTGWPMAAVTLTEDRLCGPPLLVANATDCALAAAEQVRRKAQRANRIAPSCAFANERPMNDDAPIFQPVRAEKCSLYLISPQQVGGNFPDRLKAALEPGVATAFQLRVKEVDEHELARLAEPLQRICAEAGVAFIVNDSVALTKRLGADGVHLGQSDGDIAQARAILGPEAQIGRTCHDSRHFAMEAGEQGADYVAFGAFYETTTKPSHYRPEPSILTWWSTLFEIPCVAIGGITPDNATPLIDAGADFIAVCQAVWGKEDTRAAVQAFGEVLAPAS
jgi:thiamine-phosphate pyrophosphorylase